MKKLLAALVATLPLFSLQGAAVTWTGGGDGSSWSDSANWSPGLPTAGDDVTIDVAANPTVTISTNISVGSLNCQENLALAGGGKLTLTAGASVISGSLTQANFTSITTEGATTTLTATGPATIDNASLFAKSGSTLTLTQLIGYNRNTGGGTTWQAEGTNSLLNLPGLTTITPRDAGNNLHRLKALDGGRVDVTALTAVQNGACVFESTGGGSYIDAPLLQSYDGNTFFNASGFHATGGATIHVPVLTSVIDGDLEMDATSTFQVSQLVSHDGGTIDIDQAVTFSNLTTLTRSRLNIDSFVPSLPSLTTLDNSSIYIANGLSLTLPLVTSYTHNLSGDTTLEARGAGSLLSFPNLTTFQPRAAAQDDVFVSARDGGEVTFAILTAVGDGAATFRADGVDSQVNLPALQSHDGYLYFTDSGFRAVNGGDINAPVLTTLNDCSLQIDAASSMQVAQIQSITGAGDIRIESALVLTNLTTLNSVSLYVDTAVPSFPALANIDNSSIYLSNGLSLSLPLITAIARNENGDSYLQADGANSVLSFPNVATLNPRASAQDDVFIRALNGGRVELPALTVSNNGAATFTADGVNSYIDLTLLETFDGYLFFTNSGFYALNGGTIHSPALTAINDANITIDATSTMPTAQITTLSGDGTTDLTANGGDLSGLTTLNRMTLRVSDPLPMVPNLSNIDNASIYVTGGVTFSLPLVTSYSRNEDGDSFLQADGANSVLSLPNLATLNGRSNAQDDILVNAYNGGTVNFPNVTTATTGAVTFRADGVDSLITLSSLTSYDGYRYFTDSGFRALNDGIINLHPTATVQIQDCNIQVDNGGVITAGTLLLENLADVLGNGTLAANVLSHGSFGPSDSQAGVYGILTIDGNFSQFSDGRLTFEIRGLTPGSEHDQLVVTGTTSLDGTATVNNNNFGAYPDAEVDLIQWASAAGSLATANLASLGDDLAWELRYLSSSLKLNVIVTEGPYVIGDGDGLSAEYFDDKTLTNSVLTRIDPSINFDWATGSPDPALPVDAFSARWTGSVVAGSTGDYLFHTYGDDGTRLWVDLDQSGTFEPAEQILDDWSNHAARYANSAPVPLVAGESYDLKLEYYEHVSAAVCLLQWTPPGEVISTISTRQLYSGSVNLTDSPTVAPAPDTYQQSVDVTLTSGTAGATIRYTVDGTDPDGTSPLYSGPITLTQDTFLRARAYSSSADPSAVMHATYLVEQELPDLVVTSVTAPASVMAGQTVSLTWIVQNNGLGDYNGTRVDAFHLSADAVLDGSDVASAFFAITDSIPAGLSQTYTRTFTASFESPNGDLYFIATTDANDGTPEADQLNNSTAAGTVTNIPASLALSSSVTSIAEDSSSPQFNLTLSRNGDLALPLTVSMTASISGEFTFPASVDVPAGSYSTTVPVTVLNDGISDGDQTVTLTASAGGYTGAAASVTTLDASPPSVSLFFTSTNLLEGTTADLAITRDPVTSSPLDVNLSSSNLDQFFLPTLVTIPANQASTMVTVSALQDTLLEGNKTYVVAASASGHLGYTQNIIIQDDDIPTLSLAVSPSSVSEGQGPNAATATITRTPASAEAFTVQLSNTLPSSLAVPSSVTFAAFESSKTVSLATIDNAAIDGSRSATLQAILRAPSSNSILESSNSVSLQITDDEGPTLTVSLPQESLAEGTSMVGSVSRQPITSNSVAVTLNLDASSQASVSPVTVFIGANQSSASFTFTATDDGVEDGSQTVTLEATASGHSPSSISVVVTDDQLPDLVITSASIPSSAETDETVQYSYTLGNEGTGPLTNPALIRTWLSSDQTLGDDILLNQFLFEGNLANGASVTRTESFRTPETPGLFFLIVEADADSTVEELVETNNLAISANTLQTSAAYSATVATSTTAAPANTVVTFTGSATRLDTNPATFAQVNIHIGVRGTTRVLPVLTDDSGNFSIDWTPLPGEAGSYTIAATHPSESPGTPQDSFTLYGISSSSSSLSYDLLEGLAAINQVLTLSNPSELVLTDLTASASSVPSGITATLTLGDGSPSQSLAGLSDIALDIDVSAAPGAPQSGSFQIDISSAEGATKSIPVDFTVSPSQSRLLLNVDFVQGAVVQGEQIFVQFQVSNRGATATDDLSLSLPQIPWLSTVTAMPLSPLAPGQSTEITLRLSPTSLAALGPYSGTMVLNGASTPLRIPFQFSVVSDMTGDLLVTTEDEYRYWNAEAGYPFLADAAVQVSDQFTAAVVATGTTNSSGELLIEDLPEGYYVLRCEAPGHSVFRQNIRVFAGRVNRVTAFLYRQTVTYTFVVNPIQIEERTTIRVVTEFETNVPLPVVTVDPAYVDLDELELNEQEQVIFTITNHGLIRANDMKIGFNSPPGWQITPLVNDLGDLNAQATIQVPVRFERFPEGSGKDSKECGGGAGGGGAVSWTLECGGNDNGYNSPVGVGGGGGAKCAVNPVGGGGGGSFTAPQGSQSLSNCGGDNCEINAILDCLVNFLPPPAGCLWGAMRCYQNPTFTNCLLNLFGCAAGFTPAGPIVGAELCIKGLADCAAEGKSKGDKGGKASAVAFEPFIFQLLNLRQHNQAVLDVYIEAFGDENWFTTIPDVHFYNLGELFAASIAETSEDGMFLSIAELTALENLPTPSNATPPMVSAFLLRWNRSIEYWAMGYQSSADVPSGQNTDFIEPVLYAQKAAGAIAARDAALADGFDSPSSAMEAKVFEAVDFLSVGGGICARVTLLIEQDAVLTRNAFDASLRIDNGSGTPLTNVSLDLSVLGANGADATELFGITTNEVENLSGGVLAPDSSGRYSFIIVPSGAAAPSVPVVYTVSGTLSYNEDGVDVVVPLAGQDISVFPSADLALKYFQQRDVFSDDPHTMDIIEPSVPFSLAVMAENVGAGTANNFRISSSQPQIIENEKGLLIDFNIIGSSVQGQPVEPSLEVDFGDILPGELKTARWLMTSTLHGHFIDYEATFEHENDFGIEDISTISSVEIHEMIHEVLDPRTAADALPDFLTNDLPDPNDYPDTVHLSTGTVEPVTALLFANTTTPSSSQLSVPLTIPSVPSGFIYLRVPEPSDASLQLVSVVRSDGRVLPMGVNAWTTDRTFIGFGAPPNRENNLHLFDHNSTGSYTLNYALPSPPDNTAPSSVVAPLAASSFELFPVNWSGSDNDRLAYYDVFVSVDGAAFVPWLVGTQSTSAVYAGAPDTDYAFYSIAIDASGNRESAPAGADTATTTDLINSPPILDPIASFTIAENSLIKVNPTAFDPDNTGDLIWALGAGAPSNMTINAKTGAIRWPSGEGAGGTVNPITVTVTDGTYPFASSSQSFTITVTETNSPPRLTLVGQTLDEDKAFSYQLPAQDPDLPVQTLSYQFTSAPPAGMSMNAGGLINWTTPNLQETTQYSIEVSVTDNGTPPQTTNATLNLTVRNVSAPPVIHLTDAPLIFTENNAPTSLDEISYITDPDSLSFNGGSLTMNLLGILDPGEGLQLSVGVQSGGQVVTRAQQYILVGGEVVATLVTETPGTLRFNLTEYATPARTATLIRATRYWNPSEQPTVGARQVTAQLNDGDLGISQLVVRPITVVPVLDAPIPLPDFAATIQNVSVVLSRLMENDRDLEGGTLSITGSDTTSTQGGTVSRSGNRITYTPANGYLGTDSFAYSVTSSETGLSSSANVTMDVSLAADFEPSVSTIGYNPATGQLELTYRNAPNTPFQLWHGDDLQNWSLLIPNLSPDANGTITWTLTPDLGADPVDFFQVRLP